MKQAGNEQRALTGGLAEQPQAHHRANPGAGPKRARPKPNPGEKCCMWRWRGEYRIRCPYNAKVIRDRKPYCKQHDPVARDAKIEAARARYQARRAAQDRAEAADAHMRKAYPMLVAALRGIVAAYENAGCNTKHAAYSAALGAISAATEESTP